MGLGQVQSFESHEISIRAMASRNKYREVTKIVGARCAIPGRDCDAKSDSDSKWDLTLFQGKIQKCETHKPLPADFTGVAEGVLDARGKFLAPSLCHPHVHLDKCFLLSDPEYKDLKIQTGTFQEAMQLTAKAKARFQEDDLLRRGRWLIRESIDAGVTCMRAFVEVDAIVRFKCLAAGLKLKEEFEDRCHIQICAFAQEPLFTGPDAFEGRLLMEQALQENPNIDVLGSTPYVEDEGKGLDKRNIEWVFEMAVKYTKHVDFHLDYNLDSTKQARTYDVFSSAYNVFNEMKDKTIVLGHCTRLTMMSEEELSNLLNTARSLTNVHFVGLPTSDLYMMDRYNKSAEQPFSRRRGTLPIIDLRNYYNVNAVLGINNVGNAFTPHGSCDPMHLACLGVGLYQEGAASALKSLYNAVSESAKLAIGLPRFYRWPKDALSAGSPADFVLFGRGTTDESEDVRLHKTTQDVVNDPPYHRTTIFKGYVVGSRP